MTTYDSQSQSRLLSTPRTLPDKPDDIQFSDDFEKTTLLYGDEIKNHTNIIDAAYAYWTGLASEIGAQRGTLPMRSDLDLRSMIPFLSHIILYDVVESAEDELDAHSPAHNKVDDLFALEAMPRLRVRLAGTAVTEVFGEITGQDVMEMENKTVARRVGRISGNVIRSRRPCLSITPGFDEQRQHLQAHALFLPLAGSEDTIVKLIVCLHVVVLAND